MGRSVFDTDRRVLVEMCFLLCYLGGCKGDRPDTLARVAGGTDDNGPAGVSLHADEGCFYRTSFSSDRLRSALKMGSTSYHITSTSPAVSPFLWQSPNGKLFLVEREAKIGG